MTRVMCLEWRDDCQEKTWLRSFHVTECRAARSPDKKESSSVRKPHSFRLLRIRNNFSYFDSLELITGFYSLGIGLANRITMM